MWGSTDGGTPEVTLETSMGAITVEMYYKHAPKTCRNFVELARRQYYDNVIFHRIIKDFIVQGGDPTGTGRGGESIYAVNMLLSYRAKFEDEIKSELKHIGAGILSMANAGPNTNGRQFFVTLAPCQSLDGKHTIFRRVCRGMEIVKRLGSVQTDKNDSGSQHALPMEAHAHHHHHLRQLRAALLRRGHPIPSPPAAHPDPERAHLAAIRAATASGPILTLAACACLRRAGLPPPGPRALPALLRSAARCDGAGAYVAGAHAVAARVGALGDAFVGTALVGAYAACGCVGDARRVFDGMPVKDVVSWGVMLDSYCQTRNYKAALVLFAEMKRSGVVPDQLIIATALSACGHIGHWRTGKAIHSYMLVSDILINPHLSSALINFYANCAEMDMAEKLYYGMLRKDLVSSTAMVFGYAKNRKVEVARSIFNGMPEKDVVSWSAMISGYAESNQPNEALRLFNDMQEHGVRPDEVTVLSVISACANLGSLDKASWVHSFTENNGFTRTLHICNALIDMFAKCGDIILAFNIFNKMPHKNVITWTSMITAFAMHGDGKSALVLFEQMKNEGVEPNKVTFLNLLYACCHAGLVHEGRLLFKCMVQEYRIEPNHEHYGCMVDLLGRSKLLQEAVDLIESMHLRPNEAIWGSLLAACWMHDDLKLAAFAAKRVLELDPNHDGAYVLLSKIYMKSGSWNDGEEVRGAMKLHGVTKETGSSWMELINPNYGFAAGGGIHPESNRS